MNRKEEARLEEQRQTAAAMAATLRLTRRYRLEETPPGVYRRIAWLFAAATLTVGLAAFELFRPTQQDIIEAIAAHAPIPRCDLARLAGVSLTRAEGEAAVDEGCEEKAAAPAP